MSVKNIQTLICGILFFVLSGLVVAQVTKNPQQIREEAIAISKDLRCPASLNQSLFESEKPIASELKAKIYELLRDGKSKEEIFKFFADRYGEQIRYAPEVSKSTAILWVLPAGLIIVLIGGGFMMFSKRRKQTIQK